MKQATLLISENLLKLIPDHEYAQGNLLRRLLHRFLSDPYLWEKIRLLESSKYTKTYQSEGLGLVAVKFYPLAEDWCQLSVLSNGTGFSRCYIFTYLLEYYLRIRQLKSKVTIIPNMWAHTVLCRVKVNRTHHYLERNLRPRQKQPRIPPMINIIHLPQEPLD